MFDRLFGTFVAERADTPCTYGLVTPVRSYNPLGVVFHEWVRMARDVRMFTIGGGTAQVLRTLVASRMLGWKLPQTRGGYVPKPSMRDAAE